MVKLRIMAAGRTEKGPVSHLLKEYLDRAGHYFPLEWEELPESKDVLEKLRPGETLVLFDEKGDAFTSREFAAYLGQMVNGAGKHCTFLIGGAYGFPEKIRARADAAISLSKLTFPHQLVRVFIAEQFYRAGTILRNEKYHHD